MTGRATELRSLDSQIRRLKRAITAIAVVTGLALLVLIGSLCSMSAALADQIKPLAKVDTSREFATADAAARHALKVAARQSKLYEFGGVVIQCGTRFWATTPVTINSPKHVSYDVAFPRECSIAAIYHTHPPQDVHSKLSLGLDAHARQHSANDIRTATRLGAPSYIAVVATREVIVWTPNSSF